jgi:hypothetical protein
MKAHKEPQQFVMCLRNDGAEDLVLRKVYQVLPDANAARSGYLRVIDESGEDYLYRSDFFVPVSLPEAASSVFAAK